MPPQARAGSSRRSEIRFAPVQIKRSQPEPRPHRVAPRPPGSRSSCRVSSASVYFERFAPPPVDESPHRRDEISPPRWTLHGHPEHHFGNLR